MTAFATTIFLSAFLFFWAQPLLGRFVLPWFGGVPAVWSACLLFFQGILFAGYAWAHWILKLKRIRLQVTVQVLLCACAGVTLPLVPDAYWSHHGLDQPPLLIMVMLITVAGMPCLALAATTTLAQAWFANQYPGRSPYRLYALSNAASLLALVFSTTVFELHFSRVEQAKIWSIGFGLYAFALLFAGMRSAKAKVENKERPIREKAEAPRAEGKPQIWLWLALPFCSSVLLLAFTAKLTQDFAVVPFLWTLPLGIYLITYIMAFDNPRWYPRQICGRALPVALAVVWGILFFSRLPGASGFILQLIGCLAVLFIGCLFCHGELYRFRPEPEKLSQFYLCIAAGGTWGGVVVALLAPMVFFSHAELPLGLFGCAMLGAWIYLRENRPRAEFPRTVRAAGYIVGGVLVYGLAWLGYANSNEVGTIAADRNFFGVINIRERGMNSETNKRRVMVHGSTIHGTQFLQPARRREPAAYFGSDGGFGRTWAILSDQPNLRIGAIGLGAGTIAAYTRAGDELRFYEVNRLVIKMANSHFTFLHDSPADLTVIEGDGRLSLEQEEKYDFDLLVIDAFNSGTIPIHLLTEEAFATWNNHVAQFGVIAVHITNRHLDLAPVLAASARKHGFEAVVISHRVDRENQQGTGLRSSDWCVLTRDDRVMEQLSFAENATALAAKGIPWSDETSSLISILK